MAARLQILTLNAGSSSLKAAVFAFEPAEARLAEASVERIGLADARFHASAPSAPAFERSFDGPDHASALQAVLEWLDGHPRLRDVDAVAHRIVHGGDLTAPLFITPDVVHSLRRVAAIDPDHTPQALAAIDAVSRARPGVPQVACFDTAFHASMPPVARQYPLPARFEAAGVRRYGFHGLSCEYIVSALRELDPAAADGRLVIAHLGGGASLTAVRGGRGIETTMGFSPAGGLMMSTRSGDLDPGVLLYAMAHEGNSVEAVSRLVNREAGLLGVSGSSPDVRDLLAREDKDPRAAAALELYCYTAAKALAALLVPLGGLDALVFTGGIGQHSAAIRARIAARLGAFGVAVDTTRNAAGSDVISPDASPVTVRVVATNEDLMLARHARRLLQA
jgi:acetate kinase